MPTKPVRPVPFGSWFQATSSSLPGAASRRQPERRRAWCCSAPTRAATPAPDSDLDFLVIEREVPNRHAEMVRLEREVRSLGVPVDIVVVSEAYAAEWASVKNSIVHAALNEGRELAAP
jgi:hypothetical protein